MTIQINHQFPDGRVEMCAHVDLNGPDFHDELRKFMKAYQKTKPLRDGAVWLFCNEKSEHFRK
uniref:Uncharacterized protein n=1 Tax=viral metagenome TaxID=1070528 RepID=A0A6H1ZVA1_9ZZZZ